MEHPISPYLLMREHKSIFCDELLVYQGLGESLGLCCCALGEWRTETARCLEQGLIHIYSIHNLDTAFLNWKSLIYIMIIYIYIWYMIYDIYIYMIYIYIWYIYIYIHDSWNVPMYNCLFGLRWNFNEAPWNRYGGRPNIEFPLARSPAERGGGWRSLIIPHPIQIDEDSEVVHFYGFLEFLAKIS